MLSLLLCVYHSFYLFTHGEHNALQVSPQFVYVNSWFDGNFQPMKKKKTFHKNCIIIWFSLAEVKLLVSISKALLLIKGIYLISMLGIWLCFPIIPLVDRSLVFVIFHRLFPFWIYLGEEMVYMIAVRQHSNRLNHITLYIATVSCLNEGKS